MEKLERQELFCHECANYVQFDLDLNLNGNHEIKCPNCGHIHCRVIEDGIITDKRWDSRNGNNISWVQNYVTSATNISYSTISTYDSYTMIYDNSTTIGYSATTCDSTDLDTTIFLYGSWLNATPIK